MPVIDHLCSALEGITEGGRRELLTASLRLAVIVHLIVLLRQFTDLVGE